MPRLFVAAWPPADVLDAVAELDRPERAGVRWTTRDQWHVTLRFLGTVDDEGVEAVATALAGAAAGVTPADVELGPAVEALGRQVLVVPVAGIDEVAAAVVDATAEVGKPPEDRPFRGHLTLARSKGPSVRPLAGAEISCGWRVEEVALVESRLHPHGARYHTVRRAALGGVSDG